MLISSISRGSQDATDQAIACLTMRANSRSRSSARTSFESQTPGMCLSGWRMTAPATTGPARQPRPTSSTPATYTKPWRRSAFSRVRKARTLTIASRGLLLRRLLHARGLALQVAQEIELRAADLGGAQHVDLVDHRRMQRKG